MSRNCFLELCVFYNKQHRHKMCPILLRTEMLRVFTLQTVLNVRENLVKNRLVTYGVMTKFLIMSLGNLTKATK